MSDSCIVFNRETCHAATIAYKKELIEADINKAIKEGRTAVHVSLAPSIYKAIVDWLRGLDFEVDPDQFERDIHVHW